MHAAPRLEDKSNPAEKEIGNENTSDEEGQPAGGRISGHDCRTRLQQTRLLVKQDEIPRMDRPRTNRCYYLFVEDDTGCMVEQQVEEGNMRLIRDTDTSHVLLMDQITEAEAEMYQIPEHDQPPA